MDNYKIKVIFRKFKDNGEIVAIFPLELGTYHAHTCSSYAHIGQHGACEPFYLTQVTKPAKESEYAPLKRELETIGYDLQVMQKVNRYNYLLERQRQIKEFYAK